MSLFDRDYMRSSNQPQNSFIADGNNMLWLLIAVNVLLFVLGKRYPLCSFDIKLLPVVMVRTLRVIVTEFLIY